MFECAYSKTFNFKACKHNGTSEDCKETEKRPAQLLPHKLYLPITIIIWQVFHLLSVQTKLSISQLAFQELVF